MLLGSWKGIAQTVAMVVIAVGVGAAIYAERALDVYREVAANPSRSEAPACCD
jgi:hypothetical protein